MSTPKPEVIIDGLEFGTLDEFFEHFGARSLGNASWGHNLDAFNDVLRGGSGTPEGGFRLRWLNHSVSRERLSYPETTRQLQKRLTTCHPTNRESVSKYLREAESCQGPTVFDWLLEIISVHGEGGREAEDQVELSLE